MNKGYIEQIREQIRFSDDGSVFTPSDFSEIADNNTIKQCINRLIEEGMIRRVFRGVYEKPKYSTFLGEYVATDPNLVAEALARSYRWSISPSGDTALNLLGLSTQVAAGWSYISDGPYKTYEWDNNRIEFKHRTNKEVTGLSPITIIVIQALKTMGKDNVENTTKEALSKRLNESDKAILLKEGRKATSWIYSVIKEICEIDN